MILDVLKITLILPFISLNPGCSMHVNTNNHRITKEKYTFAMIPKLTTNPFFTEARAGCEDKAKELGNVECLYVGPDNEDPEEQNAIIRELVKNGTVDGIAISVTNAEIATEAINEAIELGMPVITFDSDAPQSLRKSYVGTDNLAFGDQLAKVLQLLDPDGGKYGKYGFVSGAGPNLAQRVEGFNNQMKSIDSFKSSWTEIDYSPTDCQDNKEIALEQCYDYAHDPNVRAIVPVGGWPMWNTADRWKEFVDTFRAKKLSLVVADALDEQIELLNQGYCDGLVGQLPYEMGTLSVKTLYDIMQGETIPPEITGTNLLQVLRVPINLPPVNVNNNYIGNLRYVGIALYSIIGLTSVTFMVFSIVFRKERVIRSSNFPFISMVCIGTLICGSFIITTAIDDQYYSIKSCDIACKMTPWLLVTGFTVFFSGLFSKCLTVYLHMRKNQAERVVIDFKQTYLPLIVAMSVNFILLLCWTFVSPLHYERHPLPGLDPWNRVLETSGSCTSPNSYSVVFASILYCIALIYVIAACSMTYINKDVTTEYSESFYITLTIGATIEALVIGAPVLILTKTSPRTLYLVGIILIFMVSMMILLLIFVPKIIAIRTNAEPYPSGSNIKMPSVLSEAGTVQGDGLKVIKERTVQLSLLPSPTDQMH